MGAGAGGEATLSEPALAKLAGQLQIPVGTMRELYVECEKEGGGGRGMGGEDGNMRTIRGR